MPIMIASTITRLRKTVLFNFMLLLGTAYFVASSRAEELPANSLSAEELAQGWVLLFDGETTFGWTPSTKADWQVKDGVITVSSGEPGLLCTNSDFGNYELKLDFRAPIGTNSGVFLRTPAIPTNPAADCYELNIASPEISPFPTGSFVGRQKRSSGEETDQWRTFEVIADGAHWQVKLDGQRVLDYTDPAPLGRGKIGLQLNKGEVAFRNIKLRPLGGQPLMNGKDLTGWKELPGKNSKFTVNEKGELRIQNGNGQLESDAQFADFTLQLEVFSNGKHLNSGVFFRSIPGEFWQGYECQIQNGYKDGDRSQPVDCGTGGFYRRQNARKVVSNDFEWTHITLVVTGPHMAAWVNGLPVSDWTDTRANDPNPRKGLRLEKGTIILQGHDPTTDLSFRNFRAVEMAPR